MPLASWPVITLGCRGGVGFVRAADSAVQRPGVGPAADGRLDRPCRQDTAPVAVQLPDQAQGVAGRHRHGRGGLGVPGDRAGHRPGRAGTAHLHHRAAVHPAGGEQAGPSQAAAADLVGRGPGHGRPRRRARGRRSVGRGDERQPQGLGRGAHRHRLLRGDSDHHRRQDQGERPRGGVRPGRGLRLRADRDAAEERGGGPGHQRRRVLQLLGALRDRGRRGRRAVPAAERPAGRLAGGRPAAAHPRRRADQRLLRGDGPRRGT